MTEQLQTKCSCCGRSIPQNNDDLQNTTSLCDRCKDNSERQGFFEKMKELDREISLDELKDTLESTIKLDDNNKVITFLSMLLTYTEEDQQNIGYIAGSSTGKSYIPLQLTPYFPKEDVIELGRTNPTAFFYEQGLMLPDPTDTRDVEPEKKRKIIHVDLHQKIIVFLDNPHAELLKNLRPFLSHDRRNLEIRSVNKNRNAANRTYHAILEGYPTVIFCTANLNMDEQEKTRLTLLSPESTQEKLDAGIITRIDKEGDTEAYSKALEENSQRLFLKERIAAIKLMKFQTIRIPKELREQIYKKFKETHKAWQPRHQRDISKLMALMKASALLNYAKRPHTEQVLTINESDVIIGFSLYATISDSNELGLPPEAYEQYLKLEEGFLKPGLTISEYQREFFKKYHKLLGKDKARETLKLYEAVGLLYEETDANDHRKTRYMREGEGHTQEELRTDVNGNLTPPPNAYSLDSFPEEAP